MNVYTVVDITATGLNRAAPYGAESDLNSKRNDNSPKCNNRNQTAENIKAFSQNFVWMCAARANHLAQ